MEFNPNKLKAAPSSFKLTSQQEGAVNFALDFIKSNKNVALINGYAGTGKTTIIQYIIKNCGVSAVLSAPTHRAVKELRKKTKGLGITIKTIHSLHGLMPNMQLETFDVNDLKFDSHNEPKLKYYKLLILDESSMVNTPLYNFTIMRCKELDVKVIFIGDMAQLPPVNELMSPVFKIDNSFTLTDVVRQAQDSHLSDLILVSRNAVLDRNNSLITYITKNKLKINNGEGHMTCSFAEFVELSRYYYANFGKDLQFVRTLSRTNDRVKYWNNQLRNSINPDDDIINEFDYVTGYSSIYDEFLEPILINSEDYKIEAVKPYRSDYDLNTFIINMNEIDGGKLPSVFSIIDHTDPDTLANYINILSALRNNAINTPSHQRKGKWEEFYKFKNNYLTMEDIYLPNSKKPISKDIDYAYSLTVHKSQGQTIQNVFVDINNIMYMVNQYGKNFPINDIDFRNRLIYVALSRASSSVFMRV